MSLFQTVNYFPILAGEPVTTESGYRTRFNVQSVYSEIRPSASLKPTVYTYQSITLPDCKFEQDFVALLCMGTTPQPIPGKYLDRTKPLTPTIEVQFEGQVTYTCTSNTLERSPIKFYSRRPINEAVDVVIVDISVENGTATIGNVAEDDEIISISVDNKVSDVVAEEEEVVYIQVDNAVSGVVVEEEPDLVYIETGGAVSDVVAE